MRISMKSKTMKPLNKYITLALLSIVKMLIIESEGIDRNMVM